MKINVGCGDSPIDGWINFDNSMSVWLAQHFVLTAIFLKFLPAETKRFVNVARRNGIRYCKATRIPIADNSVEVVVSSHMLEHLDKMESEQFIHEAFRVLKPKGILRITVPDLDDQVALYVKYRDADRFLRHTMLGREDTNSAKARFKHLVVGDRGHLWMYNVQSLSCLLTKKGFVSVNPVTQGETAIKEAAGLDLSWRSEGSITIEAAKPS